VTAPVAAEPHVEHEATTPVSVSDDDEPTAPLGPDEEELLGPPTTPLPAEAAEGPPERPEEHHAESAARDALLAELDELAERAGRFEAWRLRRLRQRATSAEAATLPSLREETAHRARCVELALKRRGRRVLDRARSRSARGEGGTALEAGMRRVRRALSSASPKAMDAHVRELEGMLEELPRRRLVTPGRIAAFAAGVVLVAIVAVCTSGRDGVRLVAQTPPAEELRLELRRIDGEPAAAGTLGPGSSELRLEVEPGLYEIYADGRFTGEIVRYPEQRTARFPLPDGGAGGRERER
jgi:hypothetical protein